MARHTQHAGTLTTWQVVQVHGVAMGPVDDVVRVQVAGGMTAREAAVAVAQFEGAPEVGRDGARPTSDVGRVAVLGHPGDP